METGNEHQADGQRQRCKIITIGGEKGGTGKTTIAINLAAARAMMGRDVLLVDTDTQGSASDWLALREQRNEQLVAEGKAPLARIHSVQKFGPSLGSALRDLATRYDDIIVDAGGKDSQELRAAMTVTDLLVSPLQASSFDLWTLSKLNELHNLATPYNPELRIMVLVNRGSTNPSVKDGVEAMDFIDEIETLTRSQVEVHDRVVYKRAAMRGHSALEMDDPKAIEEVRALHREIYGDE